MRRLGNHTRVADLTVEELLTLIRSLLREELKREYQSRAISQGAILSLNRFMSVSGLQG
jgi:hypothetical protein